MTYTARMTAYKVGLIVAILSLFVLPLVVLTTSNTFAADPITPDKLLGGGTETKFNLAGDTGLGAKDVRSTIGQIINVIMGLLGTVAVVIILIGGFQWMTASGDDDKVATAKKVLTAGIIGLAIVLAAFSITKFVVESLITATSSGT